MGAFGVCAWIVPSEKSSETMARNGSFNMGGKGWIEVKTLLGTIAAGFHG